MCYAYSYHSGLNIGYYIDSYHAGLKIWYYMICIDVYVSLYNIGYCMIYIVWVRQILKCLGAEMHV
jgi:hypothetical protein